MCLQLYIYHLTYTFYFILFIHFIHLRIYVCMYVYNIYMYTFPCTHTHIRADIKYIPIRICNVISWFVWLADWLLLTYLFSVFPPGIRSPESPVRAQACSFARHRVLWGNFVWSQVFNICRAWSFSMDWFKAKFKNGHPYIWWENLWFPVDFPLNQSMEFLPPFLFFFTLCLEIFSTTLRPASPRELWCGRLGMLGLESGVGMLARLRLWNAASSGKLPWISWFFFIRIHFFR